MENIQKETIPKTRERASRSAAKTELFSLTLLIPVNQNFS